MCLIHISNQLNQSESAWAGNNARISTILTATTSPRVTRVTTNYLNYQLLTPKKSMPNTRSKSQVPWLLLPVFHNRIKPSQLPDQGGTFTHGIIITFRITLTLLQST